MKLLTDEQLCNLSLNNLRSERVYTTTQRITTANINQWKRHQELGEYLHKIEQLITEKEHQ